MAVVLNNTLYLLGEYDIVEDKPSLKVFSAPLNTLPSHHQLKWQSFQDIPWCYSAPVVLFNKFLVTAGGRQPSDVSSKISEVCAFNTLTSQWRMIANIPMAISGPAVVGIADNTIIVFRGSTKVGNWSGLVHFNDFVRL